MKKSILIVLLLLMGIMLSFSPVQAASAQEEVIYVDHSADHLKENIYSPAQIEAEKLRRQRVLAEKQEKERLQALLFPMNDAEDTAVVQAVNLSAQTSTFNSVADPYGDFALMGEVKNTGSSRAILVKITVKLYDASNTLLATESTYLKGGSIVNVSGSFTNALGSGDAGFFRLSTNTSYTGVDHYTYTFSSSASTHPFANANITFSGTPSVTNSGGKARVSGTMKNTSSQYLTYLNEVTFALYDSSGKVIDVASTYVNGSEYDTGYGIDDSALEPGASGTFAVTTLAPYTQYSTYKYSFEYHEVESVPTTTTYGFVVTTNPENGALITVTPNDDSGNGDGVTPFSRDYEEGTVVTLTAPATYKGRIFKQWWLDFAPSSSRTLQVTMDTDRVIYAEYEDAPAGDFSLTVQSSPSAGAAVTVTPNDNDGNGNGTTSFTRTYAGGTEVTLTAPSTHNGVAFAYWNVNSNPTWNRTVSVTMDEAKTATAYFQESILERWAVHVNSFPDKGVPISMTPNDSNGDGDGVTDFIRRITEGNSVTFTAPATFNGKSFWKWEIKRGGTTLMKTSLTTDVTFTVDDYLHAEVHYGSPPPNRGLAIRSLPESGVYIGISNPDINGDSSGYADFTRTYKDGSVVQISVPELFRDMQFSKILVDGTSYSNRIVEFTMDQDRSVDVVYEPIIETVIVQSYPDTGASITVTPNDNDGLASGATEFTRKYARGEYVSLTAPGVYNGKTFSRWTINGSDHEPGKTTLNFYVGGFTYYMVAVYEGGGTGATSYMLSVQSTPDTGAGISVTPNDNNGMGGDPTNFMRSYDEGTVVTLEAPASLNGNNFLKWKIDDSYKSSRTVEVTMDSNHNVVAMYDVPQPQESYSLTVQSSPASGVDITVSPSDNDGNGNGSTSFTRTYDSDSRVTLTAPSMFNGKYFSKWTVDGAAFSNRAVGITMSGNRKAVAVYGSSPPELSIDRKDLYFCYILGSQTLMPQTFTISNSGGGSLAWKITDGEDILCSPSSGANSGIINVTVDPLGRGPGTYTASIEVSADGVSNSPQYVTVHLEVKAKGDNKPPFGDFSTPEEGETVSSSVPVTGWVLDDSGVESVKIYREEGGGLVYIGDAVFVEGARPDVETAFHGYPANYKAGWGYMMLTNFLPNNGNGTFKIHAVATDTDGLQATLGVRTIVVDNANAVKPFGAVDTPTQGGIASGGKFINWGWVLTPQPNSIPVDGSSISVYVNGVNIGHPNYNVYREDIATFFPGYVNSGGAVGYFMLDTTVYDNGIHILQWSAKDSNGNTDGIGSRFFTINNIDSSRAASQSHGSSTLLVPVDGSRGQSQNLKHGLYASGNARTVDSIAPSSYVQRRAVRQLDNIAIDLSEITGNASTYSLDGFMTANGRLVKLPVGSTLDKTNGKFYWSLGPGFYGHYHLVFTATARDGSQKRKDVIVEVLPK